MKWFWAAYRKDAFPNLSSELSQQEFRTTIISTLESFDDRYTFIAKTIKGECPVGIVGILGTGWRIEPRIQWFPWASDRNKLESVVNFLNEVKKQKMAFVYAGEKDIRFFTHLCRYGIIRRGCRIKMFFEDLTDAMLFYSRIEA